MPDKNTTGDGRPSVLARLRPRKPLTVLAFVVLIVVAGSIYGLTAAGHYSTFEKGSVEGTVVGYHVTEDDYGTVVVVDVAVHNTLLRPIEVTNADLTGYAGGEAVVTVGGAYQGKVVPRGETRTVSIRLRPDEGKRETAVEAVRNHELRVTGSVWAEMSEYRFSFSVYNTTQGVDDG